MNAPTCKEKVILGKPKNSHDIEDDIIRKLKFRKP